MRPVRGGFVGDCDPAPTSDSSNFRAKRGHAGKARQPYAKGTKRHEGSLSGFRLRVFDFFSGFVLRAFRLLVFVFFYFIFVFVFAFILSLNFIRVSLFFIPVCYFSSGVVIFHPVSLFFIRVLEFFIPVLAFFIRVTLFFIFHLFI